MIIVLTKKITARLNYVCHFILKEQLGLDYSITTNLDDNEDSADTIINYSNKELSKNAFTLRPHSLLFENSIENQQIDIFYTNGQPSFFKISNSDSTFDIFAAIFYLISRYEEYLPHQKDQYGRYAHENSIAFKNNFLNKPLVNIWIDEFAKNLKNKFPEIVYFRPSFHTSISYDIDIAWSYKNKGFFRNVGGFIKSPSMNRIKVLLGKMKDPFDCDNFLDECHQKKQLSIIYFFLVAAKKGLFDKNISPKNDQYKKLISQKATKYNIGLHPSWQSNFEKDILLKEKRTLESITEKKTISSRQHYIKFSLPETFRELIKAGIQNDFSMGYGSINGFRGSAASSFFWYDLQKESISNLRLYPFCFMDANCHYEQKLTMEQSFQELDYYRKECENVNGLFIPIFHNNFLGTDPAFKGWRELYSQFISQLK